MTTLDMSTQQEIADRMNTRLMIAAAYDPTLGEVFPEVAENLVTGTMIDRFVTELATIAESVGFTAPDIDALQRMEVALQQALCVATATGIAVGVESVSAELADGGSDPWNLSDDDEEDN